MLLFIVLLLVIDRNILMVIFLVDFKSGQDGETAFLYFFLMFM